MTAKYRTTKVMVVGNVLTIKRKLPLTTGLMQSGLLHTIPMGPERAGWNCRIQASDAPQLLHKSPEGVFNSYRLIFLGCCGSKIQASCEGDLAPLGRPHDSMAFTSDHSIAVIPPTVSITSALPIPITVPLYSCVLVRMRSCISLSPDSRKM